jgi:hypothetical protein
MRFVAFFDPAARDDTSSNTAAATGLSRDNPAFDQGFAMSGKNDFACGCLASDRTIDQPHDTAVRLATNNRQFTEIFVKRHEDTFLVPGMGKDCSVTRIGRPTAGPDDVMSGSTQHLGRLP